MENFEELEAKLESEGRSILCEVVTFGEKLTTAVCDNNNLYKSLRGVWKEHQGDMISLLKENSPFYSGSVKMCNFPIVLSECLPIEKWQQVRWVGSNLDVIAMFLTN